MSVRAYITREKDIWVDEVNRTYYDNNDGDGLVKYTHTDEEYCINIWHQDHLIEKLLDYGAEDYSNNDFVGEIEIGFEDFEAFYENTHWENKEDIESIKLIKKYFDEGNDWLILKCY